MEILFAFNHRINLYAMASNVVKQVPRLPLQVSQIWNTIGTFCYCVGQRASCRIGTGKSWISDVGAVLTDGTASCRDQKDATYSKTEKSEKESATKKVQQTKMCENLSQCFTRDKNKADFKHALLILLKDNFR